MRSARRCRSARWIGFRSRKPDGGHGAQESRTSRECAESECSARAFVFCAERDRVPFDSSVRVPFRVDPEPASAAELHRALHEAIDRIVVNKEPKTALTTGAYLFMDAVLVDGTNVGTFLK